MGKGLIKRDREKRTLEQIMCANCHKIFLSYYSAAKFCCQECREEYRQRRKEEKKPVDYAERSRISLTRISEVEHRASEIGLTYGQYVAKGLD